MDRRKFITGASTVMAAAALPRVSYAKKSPNETINVAVVGINGRGVSHYAGMQSQKNVQITHIVDVDDAVLAEKLPEMKSKHGGNPTAVKDLRRVLDNKDVDVVCIATPDHWHSLATIWACQAGKDVYVEKPISHNVFEGRKAVEAARKYNRIVAAGMQSRSNPKVRKAVQFMNEGGLGRLYMAKALCYKPRNSIGVIPDSAAPKGFDFDIWLGPASTRPFNANYHPYKWHWFWDFGTTDMGNQGVHQMDVMRWGMGVKTLPSTIHGVGGIYENGLPTSQETPNTQLTTYKWDGTDIILQFEVRGWFTNAESDVRIGNLFFGSEGWMSINGGKIEVFHGRDNKPVEWESMVKASPVAADGDEEDGTHFANCIKAVRSRNYQDLNGDVLEGHISSAMCHLGNTSYRLGRTLHFDAHAEKFVNDPQADAYLTRMYRHPYVVPEMV